MKRFFIDENLSETVAVALNQVYLHVRFVGHSRANMDGWKDLAIFPELAAREFDVIVTKDYAQLEDRAERAAIREAGLHWIGAPDPDCSGAMVVVRQLASVMAAVGTLLENWPSEPTAFMLRDDGRTPFLHPPFPI